MPMVRRHEPMSTWEEGDFVEGYALVSRKERRQDKKGRDYLDLELSDRTSTFVAKAWPDSPALDSPFGDKSFVVFKGVVRLFRERLQVNIDHCRVVDDQDRTEGFKEEDYVPRTPEDLDDLRQRLVAIYPTAIARPALRALVEEALRRHGEDLGRHPAAKTIHHAYLGGLLEHVVMMAELAQKVCDQYGDIDRDLVLVGVLFHDFGKLIELGAMPANDYTLEGQMVGHVVIGYRMLLDCAAAVPEMTDELRLHLEHLVLSHHGHREYGSPVEPSTPEAMVLAAVDNLDSKLAQVRQARSNGAGLQYLRGFGRSIYLDTPAS
jgi:3'-5' exoribonuclease